MEGQSGTSFLSVRNVAVLVALWLVYELLKALYNISPLHPLSGVPGPKFAAASYLPEFYYDVVKYGCYTKEIWKMHEQYGKREFWETHKKHDCEEYHHLTMT